MCDKYFLKRIVYLFKEKKQKRIFDLFRREYLEINKSFSKYDVCIIGSDEVFNCLTPSKWGFTSQLFGNVPEARKIITYAASCGTTTYKELPVSVRERIRETFKRVDAFSVRDNNTYEFVDKLCKKSVSINLDPVLVGNFDTEMALEKITKKKRPICLIYAYGDRIHDENDIRSIKKFCKKKNMQIIAVGAPQKWADRYLVLNPFQLLELFKLSSFVITDTFHGTIFSIKYADKYSIIVRNSNSNKLCDLVNRLKQTDHVIKDFSNLDSIYDIKKNTEVIDKILEEEFENTRSYLKENLYQEIQ